MKISLTIFFVLLGFLSQSESILNGFEVPAIRLKNFNYIVSIHIEAVGAESAHSCGGGILNDRMILTAAHCFVDRPNTDINEHRKIIVIANTLFNNLAEPSQGLIQRRVERIYVPTEYFGAGYADIAIVRLQSSLKLSRHTPKLTALTLPTPDFATNGQKAYVAGYGDSTFVEGKGVSVNDALRYLEVNIVDSTNGNINQRLVQALAPQAAVARGFCNGDSGAPLVMRKKKFAGLSTDYTVVGVVLGNSDDCDDRFTPGSYTRVTAYLDNFINRVLNNPDIDDPEITVSDTTTATC